MISMVRRVVEVIVNRLIQMKEFLADVPKIAVMPLTQLVMY